MRPGINSASTTTSLAPGFCAWAISACVRMRSLPVCLRRRAARWCRIVAALVSGQSRRRARMGPEAIRTSHMEKRQPREGKAALETIGLYENVSRVIHHIDQPILVDADPCQSYQRPSELSKTQDKSPKIRTRKPGRCAREREGCSRACRRKMSWRMVCCGRSVGSHSAGRREGDRGRSRVWC
jgi:hypothetical protein